MIFKFALGSLPTFDVNAPRQKWVVTLSVCFLSSTLYVFGQVQIQKMPSLVSNELEGIVEWHDASSEIIDILPCSAV